MVDPNTPPGVKVRAADSILNHTIKAIEKEDIEARVLHHNLEVARNFQPLSAAEMQSMRDACRLDASDGHLELFKTTKKYDGDIGREMHGFPSSAELPV